jgi:hypothetical protein
VGPRFQVVLTAVLDHGMSALNLDFRFGSVSNTAAQENSFTDYGDNEHPWRTTTIPHNWRTLLILPWDLLVAEITCQHLSLKMAKPTPFNSLYPSHSFCLSSSSSLPSSHLALFLVMLKELVESEISSYNRDYPHKTLLVFMRTSFPNKYKNSLWRSRIIEYTQFISTSNIPLKKLFLFWKLLQVSRCVHSKKCCGIIHLSWI